MAQRSGSQKKPYLRTIIYGIISIAAYVFVFTHQDMMTKNFTRGGIYAVLPIITVFFFSFVHGPFANYVLSLLGIEAKKKK